MSTFLKTLVVSCLAANTLLVSARAGVPGSDASLTGAIAHLSDRRPGLAVLVGTSTMPDPIALHGTMGYVVQILEPDSRRVQSVRKALLAADVYGAVAVSSWSGSAMPVANLSVNLLVVDKLTQPSGVALDLAELSRVVAPYGHLVVGAGGDSGRVLSSAGQCGLERVALHGVGKGVLCFRKGYPSDMDEWPQFRHDASLTSTSGDIAIGPATGVRWIQGDLWTGGARQTVMILSAKGRVFYLYAPWHYESPADSLWKGFHVEARDAFNGLLLWQKAVGSATELERPMAVDGDRLYVHVRDGGRIASLDAATGNVLRTFDDTCDIIVHHGLLVTGKEHGVWDIINPADGKLVRTIASGDSAEPSITAKLFGSSYNSPTILLADSSLYTLAQSDGKKTIRKENVVSGAVAWQIPRLPGEVFHSVQRNLLFTLEIVSKNRDTGYVHAYEAATGTHLWKYRYTRKKASAGVFVAIFNRGDTVWTYDDVPQDSVGHYVPSPAEAAKDTNAQGFKHNRGYVALSAHTGKVLTVDLGLWKDFGRCGPDLATPRYILGMDFSVYAPMGDGASLSKVAGNMARGDCGFSYAPANGLRYNSDNSCACETYVQGTIAVCSDSMPDLVPRWNAVPDRLEKGPAYPFAAVDSGRQDWPIYRADALRSGVSASAVPSTPSVAWRAKAGAAVTPPVLGGGMVFVAEPDAHTVRAFSEAKGKRAWSYTAGGRIDSPPTYYRGLVLFGSCDGAVQAVRADNGALVWQFAAAPIDRRIMVRGLLESLWPVFGTVLVSQGTAYVIAGRHGDADGGMFLYALDPVSGQEKWRERISGYADVRSDPRELDLHKLAGLGFKSYAVRNDLMSTDGRTLFVSTMGVDIASKAQLTRMPGRSILCGQGTFLADNTYPNPGIPGRFDWSVAGSDTGVAWRTTKDGQMSPDAALVAFHGDTIYGIQQSQYLNHWKDWNDKREGHVFAASLGQKVDPKVDKVPYWAAGHRMFWDAIQKDNNPRYKALAVGRDRIVVANQPGGGLLGGQMADKGEVLVFDKSGALVSRTDIGAEPLFDGVALADGKVYVSTLHGEIVCLK